MHLTHIKFKPTKKIDLDFKLEDAIIDADIPKESSDIQKLYATTNKLTDELGFDLFLYFENSMVFGFDVLHKGKKLILPELNPTAIFYSNARMFHRNLISTREKLYENSPTSKEIQKEVDEKTFAFFLQFASNCIINLQCALESFANRHIPANHPFVGKDGKSFSPSIFHKIDKTLPDIKMKRFKTRHKKETLLIRLIIELRNEIIHLEPVKEETYTQYKVTYRKLIKFDYTTAIMAVQKLINFYEPNLIEECDCGKEYYYDLEIQDKV